MMDVWSWVYSILAGCKERHNHGFDMERSKDPHLSIHAKSTAKICGNVIKENIKSLLDRSTVHRL
jgi:hypothetical protein